MRHEWIRLVAASVLLVLAGCATTASGPSDRVASTAGGEGDLSRSGLANVRLAQAYLAAGKNDLAIDRATRALRSDPDAAQAHVVMGLVLEKLGDSGRAGEHYQRAAKLAPRAGYVLNTAGVWLCENGRAAEAKGLFERATQDLLYAQRQQAYFNGGRCAALAGDLATAETFLRGGLALDANDRLLLEQMVRVKVRQGDMMGARAFFQRRDALGAPGPEMLGLAVRIEEGTGDLAAARRYRERLQAEHPGYVAPAGGTP